MSGFWCQHAVPTDEQNHSIRMEKSNERQEITIGATHGRTEYSSICEQKSWALINVFVTKSDFTRYSRVANPPSRGVGLHPTQDTAGATDCSFTRPTPLSSESDTRLRWSSRVQPLTRHLYRLSAMFSFYRGARSYTYSDNRVAGN